MNRLKVSTILALACCVLQQVLVVAVAQEKRPRVAIESAGQAATTKPGAAGGAWSPALTGERRPLYRLRKSDVLEIGFTFAPEFNQTVTIRPDGFITLRGVDELYVEGITVPELREAVRSACAAMFNDPEVTVVLKDFDKPYFIATGEVTHPGKYELRGDTTVTEALAIAGGFTGQAKHSQVVLFRRASPELVEARLLDVKRMLNSRNLEEDAHLMPGDLLFVPQNLISKVKRYLPASNLGMFWNPAQF
ncbi:MAG: polysaccharide export protein [Acidobacteriia bacterium]|nr:polysaccharide export protein [Terriglobia bacterium]